MYKHLIKRAEAVIEALPYLRKFQGKTVVIKVGGGAINISPAKESMIQDAVLLKVVGINPILVHGGGPEITKILEVKGVKSKFIEGLRVTTPPIMKVVQRVLTSISQDIVKRIEKFGGRAFSLCGKKGKLIRAQKYFVITSKGKKLDLGFTGIVKGINGKILLRLIKKGYIPVVTSLGVGNDGKLYNINADQVASAIASALKASKLILLTDVPGVLSHEGKLISEVSSRKVNDLIKDGIISGGMIPKVRAALEALKNNVEKVHIIDGRIPHAVLLEIFTKSGIGTMVLP